MGKASGTTRSGSASNPTGTGVSTPKRSGYTAPVTNVKDSLAETNKQISKYFTDSGLSEEQIKAIKYTILHADSSDFITGMEALDGKRYDMAKYTTFGVASRSDTNGRYYAGVMGGIMKEARKKSDSLFGYYKQRAERQYNIPAQQQWYINVQKMGVTKNDLYKWAKSK